MFGQIIDRARALSNSLGGAIKTGLDHTYDRFDPLQRQYRDRSNVPYNLDPTIKENYLAIQRAKTQPQVAQDAKLFQPVYATIIADILRGFNNPANDATFNRPHNTYDKSYKK